MTLSGRVFVREATGLVREVGPVGAFSLAAGQMSVITGWWLLEVYGTVIPGGEAGIAILLATGLLIFPALVYGMMSAAFPRSGGDYVFISRALSPPLGFAANFYIAYNMMAGIGFVSVIVFVPSLATILSVAGTMTGNPSLLVWAAAIGNVNVTTALSAVFVIICTLIAFLDIRRFNALMVGEMILCFLGLLIAFVAMLMWNPGDFATALNNFSGTPNLYHTVISSASNMGLVSNWTVAATVGPAFLYSWSMLNGWQFSSYIGGEVKQAQKSLPAIIIISLLLNGFLYYLLYELTYHAFGYPFVSAAGFSGVSPNASIPLVWPYFVSVLLKDNPIALIIVNVALIVGVMWLALSCYPMITRSIFAWSFDRLMPAKLSDVSDRFHVPVYATILTGAMGLAFVFLYQYLGIGQYWANMIIGMIAAVTVSMVAGVVFPFRNREVFESSPRFTKMKIGNVPLLSIFASIGLVYQLYVLYGGLSNPVIGGGANPISMGFMAGVWIVAFALYYVSIWYHKREGLDVKLAFKAIPPE